MFRVLFGSSCSFYFFRFIQFLLLLMFFLVEVLKLFQAAIFFHQEWMLTWFVMFRIRTFMVSRFSNLFFRIILTPGHFIHTKFFEREIAHIVASSTLKRLFSHIFVQNFCRISILGTIFKTRIQFFIWTDTVVKVVREIRCTVAVQVSDNLCQAVSKTSVARYLRTGLNRTV